MYKEEREKKFLLHMSDCKFFTHDLANLSNTSTRIQSICHRKCTFDYFFNQKYYTTLGFLNGTPTPPPPNQFSCNVGEGLGEKFNNVNGGSI